MVVDYISLVQLAHYAHLFVVLSSLSLSVSLNLSLERVFFLQMCFKCDIGSHFPFSGYVAASASGEYIYIL